MLLAISPARIAFESTFFYGGVVERASHIVIDTLFGYSRRPCSATTFSDADVDRARMEANAVTFSIYGHEGLHFFVRYLLQLTLKITDSLDL